MSVIDADSPPRPRWQRLLWIAAGCASLLAGLVGIVLPLLPTLPFVLLAAFCFSRGSTRLENWLLTHPRLGPPIQAWRRDRAIPRRARRYAYGTLAASALIGALMLPPPWQLLPAVVAVVVALWLARLPTVESVVVPRRRR